MTTYSNFTASDENRGGTVTVILHSSTTSPDTATWKFTDPHVDGSYPDVKWVGANASNAMYGWELGSGAGVGDTLTYEASTNKMVYFVPSVWYHKFDVSAGITLASGTGTEGSSYSGTLTVNGTSLEYEIPDTSSSGTYELKADGIIQLSIVHGSTASTGSAPNFDQTKIWTLISPTGDELDVIDLTGSGTSSIKKVFCNFW